jgi:hypothetical protein
MCDEVRDGERKGEGLREKHRVCYGIERNEGSTKERE